MTYLDQNKQPTETLIDALDFLGISLDEFKLMTDDQVRDREARYNDVLNDERVTESRGGPANNERSNADSQVYGFAKYPDMHKSGAHHNDSGSYSRYFSLDAWAEANLPESVNRTFPFLIVPKASKSEKNAGLEGLPLQSAGAVPDRDTAKLNRNKQNPLYRNPHPTVKPIKLMSYLISIGSRPGDVVLDPYAGTCTTGIAAALLDRRYICIEQDADGDGWCDIGRRRIAWHVEQAQAEVIEKYDPEELREARRQYDERHKGEELDVYEVVEGSGTVMGQLDMFD